MAIEVRDANGPVPEPASFGAWSLSIKASEQCFRHLVSRSGLIRILSAQVDIRRAVHPAMVTPSPPKSRQLSVTESVVLPPVVSERQHASRQTQPA
jgi:hypothetical protein